MKPNGEQAGQTGWLVGTPLAGMYTPWGVSYTMTPVDNAYGSFCRYMEQLRKLVPIATICMHGSPLSKWDSRAIWDKYDYQPLGITAEPYFDIDFNKTFYLTDTGRRTTTHFSGPKNSLPGILRTRLNGCS